MLKGIIDNFVLYTLVVTISNGYSYSFVYVISMYSDIVTHRLTLLDLPGMSKQKLDFPYMTC